MKMRKVFFFCEISVKLLLVGSLKHSVFVFVFKWIMDVTSQRAFQPIYTMIQGIKAFYIIKHSSWNSNQSTVHFFFVQLCSELVNGRLQRLPEGTRLFVFQITIRTLLRKIFYSAKQSSHRNFIFFLSGSLKNPENGKATPLLWTHVSPPIAHLDMPPFCC